MKERRKRKLTLKKNEQNGNHNENLNRLQDQLPETDAKKPDSTRTSKTSTRNREFVVITYAFLGIFIALMGYFAYFETVKSEDFINSPYNARQDSFSSSTVRGKIMGSGGEILAESNVDAEGKETRTYPYRNLFAHVVGYSTHGKLGVESAANFNLLRSNSFFLERIVNEIRGEKNKGDDVVTTLNVSLQQAAYDALGEHDGAVVVMEPSTGRILACLLYTSYIMYAYIKGILAEITEDAIIVENQGIGYEIAVPGQVFDYLPSVGEEVKIYTYHYVREDAILLYGFLTKEDVRIFKMLIGVSGIGPKGALSILSVLSTDDLRFAILGDDAKAIAKAPGVGAKTAQRVIIELKDKLSLEDAFEQKLANQAQKAELNPAVGVKNEAILALTSLGYSQSEALKVLQGIEISPDDQVEDVLKMALKQMAFL